MKKALLIVCLIALSGTFTASGTSAQDFSTLLSAVEDLDSNLRLLIEAERASRESQIKELEKKVAALGQTDLSALEAQLVQLTSDLAYLTAENEHLRDLVSGTKHRQIVSIDGAAYSDEVQSEGTQGLTDRVESLESRLTEQKPAAKPSTSKTTVNGRLYSHGMVDFADGSDSHSEFGLSRAYVTLKSKLSSFASLRLTTDFKAIDDKYNIILKYAYLDWQPGFTDGYAKLRLGLQATQYIDQMNKLWGRRYLEKTVGDSRKFLTSSDLGISTIVGFGPKSKYGFASLALLNGTSYSHVEEVNTSKDINVVSLVKPFKNIKAFNKSTLMMQYYSGTQNEDLDDIVTVDTSSTPWDTTVTDVKSSDWKRQIFSIGGLLAWNSTLDVGFDLNFTTVGKGAGVSSVKKRGLSFFTAFYMKKLATGSRFMSSLNFFGRIDSYDPNTGNSDDGETVGIVGLESTPVKGFKVALNYRLTDYDDSALKSNNMLYVNTLFKF